MSKYTPAYSSGWKDNQAGNTPITAEALNAMEAGIKAAFRTDNLIAVYGQSINFTEGVGYYDHADIYPGHAIPFAQLRASSPEKVANAAIGLTVEEGRLRIALSNAQTVSNLPVNIIVILT